MYHPTGAADPMTADKTTWKDDVKSGAGAIVAIGSDPHLPEVICQTLKLQAIQQGKSTGPCRMIPRDYLPGKGVGLRDFVVPLRYYVAAKERPIIAGLIAFGVVLTIFSLGVSVGKGR